MRQKEGGFTLIEVMITMAIAMVILGGLLLNFTSQSGIYKYQNKRGDAALDLEFTLRFIADDLKNALVTKGNLNSSAAPTTNIFTVAGGTDITSTSSFAFKVWDTIEGDANERATRFYTFSEPVISYDRDSVATQAVQPILGDNTLANKGLKVTHFRIFQDGVNEAADRVENTGAANSGYVGLPPSLPPKQVKNAKSKDAGSSYMMPGFTILIEVEIDSAPQDGSMD
ncbi:MAG: prepilin-type N-terminal cleavage/methylation domain-containing protein, partial [Gallionellaceae bacterium]